MSLNAEITRIENAKTTLKTKLNARNDNQHQIDDETIDEYGAFVDSIPSGGGGIDWSEIGYSAEPQSIIDGYNYAVEIMNNWDETSTMSEKFKDDYDLMFMPLVDISKASTLANMFQYCKKLIDVANLDYSKATYLNYLFDGCRILKYISNFNANGRMEYTFRSCIGLETIQGTMKPTYLKGAFSGCTNLKNVPIIDCSKITGSGNYLQSAFLDCPNLTDTSLNNILDSLISASGYTGTKTLKHVGFTSTNYPTSRIEALPHYQNFVNAGWTIGY